MAPRPSGDAKEATEDVQEQTRTTSHESTHPAPPLSWKIIAVILISCISFGSSWSSGITGAMKSTLKKELKINNKQFSLLEASEDFMTATLILLSGLLTDRIGGARTILYGNIIYSVGSILVAAAAQVRSYDFMIGGRVILALGDITTQIAQYKVFSSWFPPSNGFASTLAFELAIKKIGGFVGQSSANIIAKNTGNFAWVFWVAVFMNLFTNGMTLAFYLFSKMANRKFQPVADPATGEALTEKSKRFELRKVVELPWAFWCVMAFSLTETSTAIVFTQNATELAEQRFDIDAITAGWYTATVRYAGFFLVPLLGIVVDLFGNRLSLMAFCGTGVLLAMILVTWASSASGTAAAFGIFAIAFSMGPTLIIDGIRTSMWHQSVFGSAYALKIAMNNSMNIIVRIVTGVLQDQDDNSYRRVVYVYVVLAGSSVLVAFALLLGAQKSFHLASLQWTRKQRRVNGQAWNDEKQRQGGVGAHLDRMTSRICFVSLVVLVAGGWAAYIWSAVTGNTS